MATSHLALRCILLLSAGHLSLGLVRDDLGAERDKVVTWRLARSTPSFRLGSGALVANQQDTTEDTREYCAGTTEAILPKLEQPPLTFADSELYKLDLSLSIAADSTPLPSPEMNHPQNLIYQKLMQNIDKLFGAVIAFTLFYIMLRKMPDVFPWIIQTIWKSHQQCA